MEKITSLQNKKVKEWCLLHKKKFRDETHTFLIEGEHLIEEALKEVISKEDVEEKYIRDFLNCGVIDRNSDAIRLDKIMFIYKYGSKKAKKIALDEKLKMM